MHTWKARLCGKANAWLPVGIGIGAAMGSATGAMGTWLAWGAGIGLVLATARRRDG